ncbi:hypothetical protein ITP53_11490 [Nonomuraea sp. K274]|uniref:Uncharacterized protein n=1 Tax=Nonomuraea cypriaca TaxID=1187855 RepID=A0A931ABM9_9ACTN|nr:hypothetical protein [Nonomuraea cypriaca]MBF8186362.1 hypothetical protein [Nonomuraea cypriaca]
MSTYIPSLDGDTMRIAPSDTFPKAVFIDGGAVHIKHDDLPKLVAALYEAAGMPQPVEHKHTDSDGDHMNIQPSKAHPNTAMLSSPTLSVYVTADELPEFVGKLYEAAGQQPPVILPRPAEADALGMLSGTRVHSLVGDVDGGDYLSPERAREIAALYAAAAEMLDNPEAKAKAEAVESLTRMLWEGSSLGRHESRHLAEHLAEAGYRHVGVAE